MSLPLGRDHIRDLIGKCIVTYISSFTLILVSGVSTPVTELLGRLLHFTDLIDMLF